MQQFILAFALLAAGVPALAQLAPAPQPLAGDKWIFHVRREQEGRPAAINRIETTVLRAGERNLLIALQPLDSNLGKREQFFNPDWSRTVSQGTHQNTVRKPFEFPLEAGKTWRIQWDDEQVAPGIKLERNELNFRVSGWEDVKVPAGTFRAIKVEAEGSWYREFQPQGAVVGSRITQDVRGAVGETVARKPFTPAPASGRRYQAWWYVPEMKREVKSVIEMVSPAGSVLSRETAELEKFTPAQ
jgi:hypothetical protein